MDPLYDACAALLRFMEAGPPLPWMVVYFVLAAVPVVFVHELGHALTAIHLLDEDVEIAVGDTGRLAQVQLGRISADIHAIGTPGRRAGHASFADGAATARDIVWIAIAGPLASVLLGVAAAMLLSRLAPHGIAHDLVWAITATGLGTAFNLVPLRYQDGRNGPVMRTDGLLAFDALRVIRELR